MNKRRRRGLSFGSIFVLLLTAAAIFGTYYFLTTVASDSPAAAMNIPQIISAVEHALQTTAKPEPPAMTVTLSPTAIP